MRILKSILCVLGFCLFTATVAQARVNIAIDLASQTMHVTSGDGQDYQWPVSTGRSGHLTPRGTFYPQRMMAMTYSIPYNHAPMPHSIFFTGGYAIHATYDVGALGRPASHGCVRLAPQNASLLFALVKQEGATISIFGAAPATGGYVARAGRHHRGRIQLAAYTQHRGHRHHRLTTLADAGDAHTQSYTNLVGSVGQ